MTKQFTTPIICIGIAVLASVLLVACHIDHETIALQSDWDNAVELDTSEGYIDFIANMPANESHYRYKAYRKLREQTDTKLQGSCSVDKVAIYAPKMDQRLSLADGLNTNPRTLGLKLYDVTDPGNQNEAVVDFKTEVLTNEYAEQNSTLAVPLPAGRTLSGSIRLDNYDPILFEHKFDPSSTTVKKADTMEFRTLKLSFAFSMRPAFAKMFLPICDPLTIAAIYLGYLPSEFEDSARPWFEFSGDAKLDEYMAANLDQILPIIFLVADDYSTSYWARDHMGSILATAPPEERLHLLIALLHSRSGTSIESAIDELIALNTPDSLKSIIEFGMTNDGLSRRDIELTKTGRTSIESYLRSKSGPELSRLIQEYAQNIEAEKLDLLLEWTASDTSVEK